MSEREITVGGWNEQGLLPLTLVHANHADNAAMRTYIFRLTPEESRELEQQLHARNAELDE